MQEMENEDWECENIGDEANRARSFKSMLLCSSPLHRILLLIIWYSLTDFCLESVSLFKQRNE